MMSQPYWPVKAAQLFWRCARRVHAKVARRVALAIDAPLNAQAGREGFDVPRALHEMASQQTMQHSAVSEADVAASCCNSVML